jgi:hypothetical protein
MQLGSDLIHDWDVGSYEVGNLKRPPTSQASSAKAAGTAAYAPEPRYGV